MGKSKTLVDWDDLVQNCEKWIVSGEHSSVKKVLERLNLKKVPRGQALIIAEIAWRISQPLMALQALQSAVHPENSLAKPASEKEKITYASALVNLGSLDEAMQIFESIDSKKEPEVLLRKSFCHFKNWNYSKSIPLLLEYIENPDLSPYRRLIGRVNLAAAYIDQRQWSEASDLIGFIQAECERDSHRLLLGSSYELQAQIELFQYRFADAKVLLEKALSFLKDQGGDFYLYAEKWSVICDCFLNQDSKEGLRHSLQNLTSIKDRAKELRHWETLRECDLFEAIVTSNEELTRKVIMGTPIESYRNRVRQWTGKNILPRGHFLLKIENSQSLNESNIELNSDSVDEVTNFDPYEVKEGQESLFKKPMLLALFEALTSDFYKPRHLGDLFQKVYLDEKFNPFTSPDRVLKLLKRLNFWFQEQSIPLRVQMKKSEFSIVSTGAQKVNVQITRGQRLSKEAGQFSQLKSAFKDRTFSAQDVALKMSISRASARTIIMQALQAGKIKRIGTGRSTYYRLELRNLKGVAA